jgi:hypothetical protein
LEALWMVRRKADGGPDDRYPLIGKAGFGGHAAGASVRALHRFGLQSQAQHLGDLLSLIVRGGPLRGTPVRPPMPSCA